MADRLDEHLQVMVPAFQEGKVVPFLGSGANLCGRGDFQAGQNLPNGSELARYLAEKFKFPGDDKSDLPRVSQYIATLAGTARLRDGLRQLFNRAYDPTSLHRLLAQLPALLLAQGCPPESCHQLVVTTNYDDLLEKAFREAGEPFEVVSYVSDGKHQGKFLHWSKGPILEPNAYREVSTATTSVIMKIHGAVSPEDEDRDSYVITEDHYIDYLTRIDVESLVPVLLLKRLRRSHFLFLGYSLRDWNLRAILRRLKEAQTYTYKDWAIDRKRDELEEKFWSDRDVTILTMELKDYVEALEKRMKP